MDQRYILERNRKNGFWIYIPFFTMLISIYYFISNFAFGGGVESFRLGIFIWPLVGLFGFFIFLYNRKRYPNATLLDICYIYVMVNILGIAAIATDGLYNLLKSCIYSVLWVSLIAVFMNNTYNNGISKWFKYSMRIAIPLFAVTFFTLADDINNTVVKTLNPIFYLLYLMPFALLEEKALFKYLEIGSIFASIMISNKRTAMLAFLFIAALYFFRSGKDIKIKRKSRGMWWLSAIVLIIGIFLVYNTIVNQYKVDIDWSKRFSSIAETGGGGRTERWEKFFLDMGSSNFFQYIFGHGVGYPYYHNDLMQVIYDSGIIGGTLYICMCVKLIKLYISMTKSHYKYTTAFGASLIIFFLDSAFGQVITVHTWVIQLAVFWGIVIGDYMRFWKSEEEGNNNV